MYVDGVDRTTDSTLTPLVAGNQSLRFGREETEFFLGRIDEIRIAPVARSADWMAAQFLSMSDAFVTFGGAEDRAVLSATDSVEILPAPVTLTFETDPPGLELAVGSDLEVAPFSRTVIVGSTQSVSAPAPQSLGGTIYGFHSWSDGGSQSHNLVAPSAPQTYTAFFMVPQCDDDLDNDGDGTVDWDGGSQGAEPDPTCNGNPQRLREKASSCGLGFELALALPLLLAARRTRSRRR
jgi:hypothetical protein